MDRLTESLASSSQEYTFAFGRDAGVTNYTCKATHKRVVFHSATSEPVSIRAPAGTHMLSSIQNLLILHISFAVFEKYKYRYTCYVLEELSFEFK